MTASLPTIRTFWHGGPLSRIEKLSLASFVHHGHPVILYAYDPPRGVPDGVQLADAAEILPRTAIFTHRRTGSLGPFADWFRYRLLHRYGGIWVDTDVVCLRPFDDAEPIVFGWEDARYVNTAVLGLPAGHPLAAWLAEACEHPNRIHPYDRWPRRLRKLVRRRLLGDRRDRVRWGEYGPKGFTRAVHYFGLLGAAKPVEEFYPVPCAGWHTVFAARSDARSAQSLYPASRAVHLWHAMMHRQPGFDKNGLFPPTSVFETLWRAYTQKRRDSDSDALSMS